MTSRPLALAAALTLPAVLVLAGCTAKEAASSDGGSVPVTVTASDTGCALSRAEAPAGKVEFTITNTGTKVNEFYVYANGDRVVGEVENIGPGLTRSVLVDLAEPGSYETACKPGMVGDGIRSAFTVTG